MSIIDETGERSIRMAYLAIAGSHSVNGVASVHTELLKTRVFADFNEFFPGRFVNITNGITPRRWLNQANQPLAKLICERIGHGWVTNLGELAQLSPLTEDDEFRAEFLRIKAQNKLSLADYFQQHLGVRVSPDSLFDVQVKRIHEYKRQLLNLLHVITRYNRIRQNPQGDFVPRTVIFAGKSAPGYHMAKLIIRLIHDVADIVNNDPLVGERLKVVFVPNYDVSTAAVIIPAADLSEQISTAGTEASGTGNMKLALNGAVTIGTLDGANIEIKEHVGADNIFIFGRNVDEVNELRASGYNPWEWYHANPELRQVLEMIGGGYFSPSEPDRYQAIIQTLTDGGDNYLLLPDFDSYIAAQDEVDALYRDTEAWSRMAILNVARMGWFSSDRTIREYAERIWKIKPVPV